MNEQIGRFKIWDTLEKKILQGQYALSSFNDVSSLKQLKRDKDGVYLHAIGRRDRYIIIPELPRKDGRGNVLSVGDLLSSPTTVEMWVIRFDLIQGVYCSMISMPDTYNKLDYLLEQGLYKVGDIFEGVVLREGDHHTAVATFNVEAFV